MGLNTVPVSFLVRSCFVPLLAWHMRTERERYRVYIKVGYMHRHLSCRYHLQKRAVVLVR